VNMPTAHRPSRPVGEAVACGAGQDGAMGPEPVGPDFKRGFIAVMIFKFPMDFGIWPNFGNLNKWRFRRNFDVWNFPKFF
jgi:hypothetical protein